MHVWSSFDVYRSVIHNRLFHSTLACDQITRLLSIFLKASIYFSHKLNEHTTENSLQYIDLWEHNSSSNNNKKINNSTRVNLKKSGGHNKISNIQFNTWYSITLRCAVRCINCPHWSDLQNYYRSRLDKMNDSKIFDAQNFQVSKV